MGWDARIILDYSPFVRWETSIASLILVRFVLAILVWVFFKAISEVFGWMLSIEEHLNALREQLRSGRSQ